MERMMARNARSSFGSRVPVSDTGAGSVATQRSSRRGFYQFQLYHGAEFDLFGCRDAASGSVLHDGRTENAAQDER